MKLVCYFLVFTFILLSSCQNNNPSSSEENTKPDSIFATDSLDTSGGPATIAISSEYLIVPGRSIGQTSLGEDVETLTNTLGKPDFSDAAMGKAWLVWFGKQRDEHNNRTELDVYVTYKDSTMTSKVVKQIRTTSAAFKVSDSVHVYASLATLKTRFPDIAPVRKYKDGERDITLYDDVKRGIAFDVALAGNQQICTGITVHEPGKSVNDVYIQLQQEIKAH